MARSMRVEYAACVTSTAMELVSSPPGLQLSASAGTASTTERKAEKPPATNRRAAETMGSAEVTSVGIKTARTVLERHAVGRACLVPATGPDKAAPTRPPPGPESKPDDPVFGPLTRWSSSGV